jgi:ribose 5-phosphate isomerase B
MKIFLGADHRGFYLKEKIKKYLKKLGFTFEDLGNKIFDPRDDYPDFSFLVAKKVAQNKKNRGILICGSGAGVCVAANKVKNIRAGQAFNAQQTEHMRLADDINILCLDADRLKEKQAQDIVKTFLKTKFSNLKHHQRRLQKIKEIEKGNFYEKKRKEK